MHKLFQIGVPIHEIGHALGLYHEQSRPDRDQYVSVIKENIDPSQIFNFVEKSVTDVATNGVSYDYGSVMHYGSQVRSPYYKVLCCKMKVTLFKV